MRSIIGRFLLLRSVKVPLRAVIHGYFSIRSSWPIWFYVLNREPRRLFGGDLPKLNEVQERIVRDLRETGITVTHIDELFPERKLLPVLQQYTNALLSAAQVHTKKTYLRNLWDQDPIIDFGNPFVKLAIDGAVINVINSYMEMYSRLFAMSLNVTVPMENGAQAFGSQRWHRDPEDPRMCKLLIYLNDVDEESGPFVYIPRSKHGLMWGSLFPQYSPLGNYPGPGEVERAIPKEAVKVCVGPAGTTICCDTSGLHKGGYSASRERIMFTASYRSKASPWATSFGYADDYEDQGEEENLGSASRYALRSNSRHKVNEFLIGLFRKSCG